MTSRFSRAQGGEAGWEGSKLFGTSAVELSGQKCSGGRWIQGSGTHRASSLCRYRFRSTKKWMIVDSGKQMKLHKTTQSEKRFRQKPEGPGRQGVKREGESESRLREHHHRGGGSTMQQPPNPKPDYLPSHHHHH